MKKILAICLSLIAVVSLAGCGSQAATTPTEDQIKVSDFKVNANTVEDMCKKMKEKDYIPDDGVKTDAEIIGAKSGYRFAKTVNGSQMTVEFYEFDLNKLPDEGKKTIDSVKKDNKFKIIETDVNAEMSENSKYMMIYTDEKSQGEKVADENKELRENITKLFNEEK